MSNHVLYLEVPVLEELTRDAWVAFKQAYRLYTVRGGSTPMRSLLSDAVMVHLELICDKMDVSSVVCHQIIWVKKTKFYVFGSLNWSAKSGAILTENVQVMAIFSNLIF